MKLQSAATSVLERTSRLLRAGPANSAHKSMSEPAWFKVVASHPPSHTLQKQPRFRSASKTSIAANASKGAIYQTRAKSPFGTNPKHLYKPKEVKYFEDKIRNEFYSQHPWELARPKLVLENDGLDARRCDWSTIDQKYKRLDGENVVQRTLWLMETNDHGNKENWRKWYDQALMEFYRLRMRQEAVNQVAAEEASMFGSVFGPSNIEQGLALEQKAIDKWFVDATQASKLLNSKTSGRA